MSPAAFFRSRAGIFGSLAALVVSATGVALREPTIVAWMAHPARLSRDGQAPQTTLDGAALCRIALAAGPWLLLALATAVAWVSSRETAPDRAAPPIEPPSSRTRLLLVGLLACAVLLRLPSLGQSLWYDEIVPFGGYSVLGPGATVGNYYSQANHVFSQLLLWCTSALFGATEFSLRLPAFLASLVAVVAVWGAAREASDERTGLFAAAAMAVLPLNALAGTDARGYAITIACAAVALWALARVRRTGSLAAWSILALAVALGAWAHLVVIVFALGIGAVFAIELLRVRTHRHAVAGLLALVASAVLTLILYSPILPDLLALRSQFRSEFGAHSASVPALTGPEGQAALLSLGGAWWLWPAVPGGILAALGAVALAREPRLRPIVLAGLLGFPLTFALAAMANSWLYARFVLFALPAIALLIALGCTRLTRLHRLAPAAAWATLAVVSAVHLSLLPPRQPLREAFFLARAATGPTAPIGIVGLRDNPMAYFGLIHRQPLVDFGDRGAFLERDLARTRPKAIVVLYPDTLPDAANERLRAAGYTATTRLPGWIDWGAGAVDVRTLSSTTPTTQPPTMKP